MLLDPKADTVKPPSGVDQRLSPRAMFRPDGTAVSKRPLRKTLRTMWRQRWLYALVLPAIALVAVFNYLPIYGLTLAFRDYSPSFGPFGSPWAKPLFYNFWFLRDPEFWRVMGNTLRISVVKFIFGWPAPIVLALLLNEVANRTYKRIVQTVTYLPHFISWVIYAGIIYKLLDFAPDSPFNVLRGLFGLDPVSILGDPNAFIPILVVSNLLKEVGWGTIIYLAAIMGIDPQLYEAAIVDGGNKRVQLWHITLPGLLPTIAILAVLQIPALLAAGFDQVYNMKNPSVERIANITDIYVLRMGIIQGEYAYATALGLVFSLLALILTYTANRISKGSVGTGIW